MLRKDEEHSFMNEIREMIVDSLEDILGMKYKFEDLAYIIIDIIDKKYLRDKDMSLLLCGKFIVAMEDFLDMQDDMGNPYDVDGGLAQLYNDAAITMSRQVMTFLMCDLSDKYPNEYDNGKIVTVNTDLKYKIIEEIYDEFYGKIENFWSRSENWLDDDD